MKKSLSFVVLYVVVGLMLVYAIVATTGSASEVEAKITQLISLTERKAIKTNILETEAIQKVESYKTFGERPVNPGDTSRGNPFEGI